MYATPTPPPAEFPAVLTEIDSVLKNAMAEVLLKGDFNTQSQSCGYKVFDARG